MISRAKAYESINTLGLSQLELILKVYDGAISSFKEAGDFYQKGNSVKGFELLEKAKKFITHLYTTLDPQNGGEIAEKLGKIYAFILNQTSLAQATKELKIIDDNIKVLGNIREGWVLLKKQQKGNQPLENKEPGKKDTPGSFATSA